MDNLLQLCTLCFVYSPYILKISDSREMHEWIFFCKEINYMKKKIISAFCIKYQEVSILTSDLVLFFFVLYVNNAFKY